MSKLVVYVDYDDNVEYLFDVAVKYAKCFSLEICLVHISEVEPDFIGYDVGPENERQWRSQELRHEHRMLEDGVKRIIKSGVAAGYVMKDGSATSAIIGILEEKKAQVVMLTYGNTEIDKGLLKAINNESAYTVILVPKN